MKRVLENIAIACLKLVICNRRNDRIANFDETAPWSTQVRIKATFEFPIL